MDIYIILTKVYKEKRNKKCSDMYYLQHISHREGNH